MPLKLVYLATPYTHPDPSVRLHRYDVACTLLARLTKEYPEWAFYSPIVHWHCIALKHKLPTDAKFWWTQNEAYLAKCDIVCVGKIEGWVASVGIDMEIQYAKEHNKELVYVDVEVIS